MPHTSEEEDNLALVLTMCDQVLVPLDSRPVDCFVAADYVQHSPLAPPGRDALKAFLDDIRPNSPDATQDLKRSFVDGDHDVLHYLVRRFISDPGMMLCASSA